MKHDPKFAQSVLVLEAQGGPAWETFLAGLTEYREQCIKDLLTSDPMTTPVNQGRARGADEILAAIKNARATASRNK